MTIEWRLHKIYSAEEEEERASKALELNGITPLEGIGQEDFSSEISFGNAMESEPTKKNFVQLKAASKTKPTVRVNKAKKESLVDQLLRQQRQAKLKAAASPHQVIVPPPSSVSSVQIAAALPTHDVTRDMVEPID
jgi:hypothetical protein